MAERLEEEASSPRSTTFTFVRRPERSHGTGRRMRVISDELNGTISSLNSLITGLRELGRSRFSGQSRNYRGRGRRFFKYPLGEELPSLE